MDQLLGRYRHWRFKNTFLLLLILIIFFYFADSPFILNVIESIRDLGYLGAFFTGIFFVSTFTVVPASVVLFRLIGEMHVLEIALLAGLGGVVGDYLIFRFLKDGVYEELRPILLRVGGMKLSHILATPYFVWLTPVVGALIIASPLPDEIGVGLLGASKIKNWQFLTLSWVLNTGGIFLMLVLASAIV